MRPIYVRLMDRLYWLCIGIGIVSVVCMTLLIFAGVIMRYIFLIGANFAEPLSIFFAVQLTMYGAAACLRAGVHLRLTLFVDMLPERLRPLPMHLVQLLLGAIGVFMVIYGQSLVRTTWFQAYPEFVYVRVGFVYSAIPISGLFTVLFVVESWLYPQAMAQELEDEARHAEKFAEEEARRLTL
ncbi:TRAP transporter small permease [Microbaculum marinum]|uniref:TRAP transporter small permease protein n=1 Tax=Microbaculum marinum TaxID=1764581 RepID=A0AAW9RT96_9HYPH